MSDDNIIPLNRTLELVRGTSQGRPTAHLCAHTVRVLDKDARTVECQRCGTPFEAFDVLNELLTRNSELLYARAERKLLIAKIGALKETLRRLKDGVVLPEGSEGSADWVHRLLYAVGEKAREALLEHQQTEKTEPRTVAAAVVMGSTP